jgi:probable phosphoglycerate mutase
VSIFYLIRHATNDLVGKAIAGRKPGVHLNETGRREADQLAKKLGQVGISRIFSSPMERAQETAAPLARITGLNVEIRQSLLEVDFGDWTGRTLADLEQEPGWKQWTDSKTTIRVPNGETILEVQSRMVGEIQNLHASFPNETMAVFSHGDPLRTILFFYLGLSLDLFDRIEVSPASYSILKLEQGQAQMLGVNLPA